MTKFRLFVFVLLAAGMAMGQRPTSSFSAADSHGIDSIDLSTLVPTINIGVVSKGAGMLPGNIDLESPQNCFIGSTNGSGQSPWRCGNSNTDPGVSFYHVESALIGLTPTFTSTTAGGCTTYFINGLSGVDGLTFYPLSLTLHYPSTCGSLSGTATTTDNSGITATVSAAGGAGPFLSSWSDASGNTGGFSAGNFSVFDPFSNEIQDNGSKFTDTLGAVTNFSGLLGGLPNNYQYTDTTGTAHNVSFTTGTASTFVPLGSACGTSGTGGTSVTPVTSINYPDSTSIGLGWQTNGSGLSGLVNSITLRTGGTISYNYGTLLDSGCLDSTHQISIWAFNSLKRTTPDGETDYSTTNTAGVGTAGTITTTVLDPGKNKTIYTFVTASIQSLPFLASVYRYQNTNTVASPTYALVSNINYCYNGGACPATAAPTGAVTQYDIYNYVGPSSLQMNHVELTYDSYGDVLTDAVTDSITTGTPTVTKTIVYGTYSSGSCSALGNTTIHNHPCKITTTNGGTWLAETHFAYNSNGAPTSTTQCLNSTCSSTLATSYSPNSTGTIASVTLPNNQSVSYTYTTGSGTTCSSSSAALLLASSSTTVNGVTLNPSQTWDCNGGVVTSTTDANSNEDDTTYDSMFRVATYTNRLENQATFNYTATSLKVTDFAGVVRYTYLDSSGRPLIGQTKQSSTSSNYDTVSKAYAWNGTNFQMTTSVPCVTTLDNPCSTVAMTILVNPVLGAVKDTDANGGTKIWGRNANDTQVTIGPASSGENTKSSIVEENGFGQITSVCNVLGGMGSACHQQSNSNGVFSTTTYTFGAGTYTTSTTRGVQTHTAIKDTLGRVTQLTTPEAGTTNLFYDSIPSGCWNSLLNMSGFLTASQDNIGTFNCYGYDVIGRVLYVRGHNATGTNPTCKHFYYDNSIGYFGLGPPSGYPSSGANIVGRMAEAETDNCFSTTPITDEWFAYNKNGQMTDMWELNPKSASTYRHTTVTYDADGTPTSLVGLLNYSGTITWGVDGEDRWNTVTAGSSTVVSGVTYDAASSPTQISIGSSTDKDTYSYDNMHNPLQYQLFVGSGSNKGVLTWNNNGSLASLAITDTLNTNNSQTCNFTYDDLARLVTDYCGSVWSQTGSYDQYGNLTKAGSKSWNPGYSATNNQFQNGATYDLDGNLLTDGASNTYTWTYFGKMASENGTAVTYDAFDRMVVFGSYEHLYSPMGYVGAFSAGNPYVTRIPAPGGSTFDIDPNNGLHYYHQDWIGTVRTAGNMFGLLDWSKSYSPFGDQYNGTGLDQTFAGLNGNTFTGVTLSTPNRELATNAFRWLSPDPAGASWNAYAYPTDPNTTTDPSGLCGDPTECGDLYGQDYPGQGNAPICTGGSIDPGVCFDIFNGKGSDFTFNGNSGVGFSNSNSAGFFTPFGSTGNGSVWNFNANGGLGGTSTVALGSAILPKLNTIANRTQAARITMGLRRAIRQGDLIGVRTPSLTERDWIINRAAELEFRGMDEGAALTFAMDEYTQGANASASEGLIRAVMDQNNAMADAIEGNAVAKFEGLGQFPKWIIGIAGPVAVAQTVISLQGDAHALSTGEICKAYCVAGRPAPPMAQSWSEKLWTQFKWTIGIDAFSPIL